MLIKLSIGEMRGKESLNWLIAFYRGAAVLHSDANSVPKTYYIVATDKGSVPAVKGDLNDPSACESEIDNEIPEYNDDDKQPESKRICIKCILGVAVLLCIISLFFYNYQSGKSDLSQYQLEKPMPKEVAEPLQDSGTIQFTKFLSAESGGNLDTLMPFFSSGIVRFQQLLAPNLAQVEDYYRNKWRTTPFPSQTLKRVQKINRRTYIFTISENKVATAGMSGNNSYEVVKRVIFSNHYRILSIKTLDTLNSH